MKYIAMAGAFCLLIGTPAVAGEWYAGGGLGNSKLASGGLGFSATTEALKLNVGYQFNDYFGMDIGYVSTLSDASDDVFSVPINLGLSATSLRTVLSIPLSGKSIDRSGASLLAALGYYDGKLSVSSDLAPGASASGSDDGLVWAVGGRYRWDKFALGLEYEDYDADGATINTINLTFLWSF